MSQALVLNVTEQPLAVVPARRAVVLVLKDKADVVANNGVIFHSENIQMEAPSVIRLRYFVNIPYKKKGSPLTRKAVFARDNWECQYCGGEAENIDHVIPKSKGGLHVWENVVAACRRCNAKKAHHTLEEVGLVLKSVPLAPKGWATPSRSLPEWEPYLG